MIFIYEYRAGIIRIIDGDTLWLDCDLGFDVRRKDSFRLYGINAPELSTVAGQEAKVWLQEQLSGGLAYVRTVRDRKEKYGRYLAILYVAGEDGQVVDVNHLMVESGIAEDYTAVHNRTIEPPPE